MGPRALLTAAPAVLLLLPLVAATLTCPSAPPDSAKVCGSDNATYDSDCHLTLVQRTHPALVVIHPGPCTAQDDIVECTPARLRQCPHNVTCDCDDHDKECRYMCDLKCHCGCGGYFAAGPVDYGTWLARMNETGCSEEQFDCMIGCNSEKCADQCEQQIRKCNCENMQQSSAATLTVTTSTSAATKRPTIQAYNSTQLACMEKESCITPTRSECTAGDLRCQKLGELKCNCGCLGYREEGRPDAQCMKDKRCVTRSLQPMVHCGVDAECVSRVALDLMHCQCGCIRQNGA